MDLLDDKSLIRSFFAIWLCFFSSDPNFYIVYHRTTGKKGCVPARYVTADRLRATSLWECDCEGNTLIDGNSTDE